MRHQPTFLDLLWEEPQQQAPVQNENLHKHASAMFVAYIRKFAPQMVNGKQPIHKTNSGYMTNTSPYSGNGQLELNLEKSVIIYRHVKPVMVGNGYEYPLVDETFKVEIKADQMIVHPAA